MNPSPRQRAVWLARVLVSVLVLTACRSAPSVDAGQDAGDPFQDGFDFDDVIVDDALEDAALPSNDAEVLPPDARVPCGTRTCRPNQACVQDCCLDTCTPMPDGGACPAGSSPAECGVPGEPSCLTRCTPPAPRCVDVPGVCDPTALCACFDVDPCTSGGLCIYDLPTPRRAIRCDCSSD